MGNGFSETQQKIMDLLADGLPHTRAEVHGCLPDELAQVTAIERHISVMRGSLNARGLDIVSRAGCYRLVRLLTSPYKE